MKCNNWKNTYPFTLLMCRNKIVKTIYFYTK